MANPQLEHGHIRVANEVWEHLMRAGLTGTEWDVVAAVLRRSWGWGKKDASISLKDFREVTERDGEAIRYAIQMLQKKKLLIQINAATFQSPACWKFNKDWESWVSVKSKRGIPEVAGSPTVPHTPTVRGEDSPGCIGGECPGSMGDPPQKNEAQTQANQPDVAAGVAPKDNIKQIKDIKITRTPENGGDPRFKSVVDFFFAEYERQRGIRFVPHKSEFKALKDLLHKTAGQQVFEADALKASIRRFLSSGDSFHLKQGKPLGYWAANINAFMGHIERAANVRNAGNCKRQHPFEAAGAPEYTGK